MPTRELMDEYERARGRHAASTRELCDLLTQMAIATLADVLPGARAIEAVGEYNEDWIPTLRVQRVRGSAGVVLFDVGAGHTNRAVEDEIDVVDIEYLDALIDLSPGDYLGSPTIASN